MTQNNLTVRMRTTGLVWVPIEQIDPHPLNWRTHPERQRRMAGMGLEPRLLS